MPTLLVTVLVLISVLPGSPSEATSRDLMQAQLVAPRAVSLARDQAAAGVSLPKIAPAHGANCALCLDEGEHLPADGIMADDGGPSLEGVIGDDDRVRVQATTDFPWAAIADLDVHFPSSPIAGTCTGFFVGPHTVATAGHCIYDPRYGGKATSIKVMPGRNGGAEPFGAATVPPASLHTPPQWNDSQDPQYDYGAIILPNDDLGNQVGWFKYGGLSDDELTDQLVNVAGYPGYDPEDPNTLKFLDPECLVIPGCQLWVDADPVADLTPRLVSYAADTSGGQSGAPVWRFNGSWQAVAIHTYSYREPSPCAAGLNCGTRINSEVIQHLQQWGGESPPPAPPPPPAPGPCVDRADFLDVESYPDGTVVQAGQSMDKWWRVQNTGTCDWDGYKLMFESGEQMGGASPVPIPYTGAGDTVDIHVAMQAPTPGGEHAGYWRIVSANGAWVDGGRLWIKVNVLGSTPTDHIASFTADPPSPSSATIVRLHARVNWWPEFRAMRVRIGNQSIETSEVDHVFEWHTASEPRGDHAIVLEVATHSNTSWTNPERRTMVYTLEGTPAPSNHAPNRPTLVSPYDWYVYYSGNTAQLCAQANGDPDGDGIAGYYFDIHDSAQLWNSGWIGSNCVATSALGPYTYQWRVKVRDSHGAESEWSDSWHFTLVNPNLSISELYFQPQDANSEQVKIRACTTGQGGIGITMRVSVNDANDGSGNGTWHIIKELGVPCFNDVDAPIWNTLGYGDGPHRVRAEAHGTNTDWNGAAVREETYTLPHRRPASPELVAPRHNSWVNSRTVTFRWTEAIRAQSYTLRVSTNPNPDTNPIVDQTFPAGTTSYEFTFDQDYQDLYWWVYANNDQGHTGPGAWHFGIDRIAPTCSVGPLDPVTPYNVFPVSWSGSDDPSAVHSYDIQVRDGPRGDWADWLTDVPSGTTVSLFNGQPGHTYYLRCRPTDLADNTGTYAPGDGDTYALVDPTSVPPPPWWNSSYALKRNLTILNNMAIPLPTGYPVHLHFDSNSNPTAADIYTASLSNPKCNDLRITYNNQTELDRVVQNCSASTVDIFFRTQAATPPLTADQASYQLYYGYAGAGSPPGTLGTVFYPAVDTHTRAALYLQEGAGSVAYDSSPWGNNGAIGADGYWSEGKWGKAIAFPTTDGQAVNLGAPPSLNVGQITVEGWYRHDTPSWWARLAGQLGGGGQNTGENKWLFEYRERRLHVHIWPWGDGVVETPDFLPTGATGWHHYAFTFDGSHTVKIYFDGVLKATGTVGGPWPSTNTTTEFGCSEQGSRVKGRMQNLRISDVVRSDFSYGAFSAITTEPSVAAGAPQAPPVGGSPDLVLQSLTAYPSGSGLEGGVIVQATVTNQGDQATENGFFTDMYADHLPTGAGDYTGSLHFWIANPIQPGSTMTLTTMLTGIQPQLSVAGSDVSIAESSTTLYGQVDSTGVITEPDDQNNISGGTEVCVASDDSYESDDTYLEAQPVLGPQTHNVGTLADQDWVSFEAEEGQTYVLATSNLGPNADTYLYLYDTDGQTLLAANDDYGGTLASQILWTCPAAGTYYVAVKHWNPNVSGCGTTYDLSISEQHLCFFPLGMKGAAGTSALGEPAPAATALPSATATVTPTSTPTLAPTPTLTETATGTPTATLTVTPSFTVTASPTPSHTPTATETQTAPSKETSTNTPSAAPTEAVIPPPTEAPTPSATEEAPP